MPSSLDDFYTWKTSVTCKQTNQCVATRLFNKGHMQANQPHAMCSHKALAHTHTTAHHAMSFTFTCIEASQLQLCTQGGMVYLHQLACTWFFLIAKLKITNHSINAFHIPTNHAKPEQVLSSTFSMCS